jgi:tRNA1Val (adenine37-N6)-methyltransferase
MILKENERLDYVNDDIELIQNTDGLTFGTDALLLAGYINGRHELGAELGGGTGIISMLLLARGKVKKIDCLEIQEEYAELIGRNAEHNGFTDRLVPICTDVRDYRPEREREIIFTNPPYMKTTSGRANAFDKKNIARHEVAGTIYDFCRAGSRALKYGGTFAVVYRPDRLIDLVDAMRAEGLEPKRMTFVHANRLSEPSMVLIEAKKGGKCGLKLTRPLIIYKNTDNKEYSDDMEYIMKEGSFPKEYKV